MNFKIIQATIVTCVCVAALSALTLTSYSEGSNKQRETSADVSSLQSVDERLMSNKIQVVDTTSESDVEDWTINDENQPYKEVRLDQQLLETVNKDKLYVQVHLRMDEEAIRSEYNETYPNCAEDYNHWFRHLCKSGDQMVKELVSDYGITYENLEPVYKFSGYFCCELDKSEISTLLADSRVCEIVYFIGELPIEQDF